MQAFQRMSNPSLNGFPELIKLTAAIGHLLMPTSWVTIRRSTDEGVWTWWHCGGEFEKMCHSCVFNCSMFVGNHKHVWVWRYHEYRIRWTIVTLISAVFHGYCYHRGGSNSPAGSAMARPLFVLRHFYLVGVAIDTHLPPLSFLVRWLYM